MEEAAVQKNIKRWHRRKRILIILAIIAIIAIIILSIVLSVTLQTETCATDGCKKTANLIISRMDPSVDPCNNFYDFACGNFIKNTKIPKNQFSVNSFTTVNDEVVQQLKEVLEEPANSSDPRSFKLAKKYYRTCMNEMKIENDNLATIKNIIKKLGGWPILEGDKWNDTKFDWKNLTYKLNKFGFDTSYFLKINIETDSMNNSKHIIQISQPDYGYTRDLKLVNDNDLVYKYYYNFIVETAIYLGADRIIAERDASQILHFYRLLTTFSLSREELRDTMKQYNALTIEAMEQKYPYIPWLEYINNLYYRTLTVTKDEIVVNQTPQFIKNFGIILLSDKRAIANYILWTKIKDVMSTLPKEMREIRLRFESAAVGITEEKERWTDCVSKTHKYFGLVTGALYIRKYFNPEAKHKAVKLIENIRNVFVTDILQKNNWMDDTTKKRAVEKAEAMSVHIGYPDQLLDDKILDNFYQKVFIIKVHSYWSVQTPLKINDNLLESNLLISQFLRNFSISRLRQSVNETEWVIIGMITASVNAFYIFNRNVIGFPAGILQDIFFSKDRPSYVNYGAIGYIIGHEISHGFDDQGREFDQIGNLVNWWTNESEYHFYQKSVDIANQYKSYVIPELNVTMNGQMTLGENIADNGGVKTAYHAYISLKEDPELPLPGLTSYTPHQMFWISAASTWCSIERPDYLHMAVTSDPHSPARFRVIGPLSNSDEFANDFNCPVGSNMNPKVKHQLW